MNRLLAICCLAALLAGGARAAEEPDRGFAGSGQLGLVSARGNTESDTLNAGLTGSWTGAAWKYEAGISALRAEEGGETSADRWRVSAAVHRELGGRGYLFANGRHLDDSFGAFATQSAVAVGYGRHLLRGPERTLEGELGAGYRESDACLARDPRGECAATAGADGESVVTGRLDASWKVSETATLTDLVRVERGAENTYFETRFALTASVARALSLQLAWELQHNSDVPAGSAHTDTLTTVSLVVDF